VNWRVHSAQPSAWNVTSPGARRTWTGAPSQAAAFNLACSLARIDTMLARIPRPSFVRVR
jgi:hypothetical protein